MDTPEKAYLRSRAAWLASLNVRSRRRIKRLQQTRRRLEKKNAQLQNVLTTLTEENILLKEQAAVLDSLGTANQHLLQRQVGKQSVASMPAAYSPELRTFALTLNFYSPRAYRYVRKVFDTCLPHPRTLRKWYETVDGQPGLSSEAFHALKLKCIETRSKGYQTICSLMVDEMSIRQQIQWNRRCFEGFVDIGTGFDSDSLPQAKAAFVIMAVAINGHWKLPLGYFLVDGINGQQRANLVNQCLQSMHDAGAMVVSVTCDGAPANLSMLQELGCNFQNLRNLKTTFAHPTTRQPVAAFLDPCHMLKLIRNALAHKGCFIDQNGKAVCWEHIEQLQSVQQTEGLHLANKLRRAHIEWERQPMKVSLAAQVMSTSVATALAECRELQLEGFSNTQPTENFILYINNIFDALNSRSMHQKGFKKPLHEKNAKVIETMFESATQYLYSLRENASRKRIIETGRKTGFLGFVICMKSLIDLFNFLVVKKQLLKYIPAHKICQDHLELFFGLIRAHGGHNDNPTAQQFRAAFRKVIVQNELADVSTGNCLSLDSIAILSCSSSTKASSMKVLNESVQRKQLLDAETIEESHISSEHDYIIAPEYISECGGRIVTYMAGYVAHKLSSKLTCEYCTTALLTTQPGESYSLIVRKNRGGLRFPSESVLKICRKSESLVRMALHMKKLASRTLLHDLLHQVVEAFYRKDLFAELHEHMFENTPLDNHYIHLVRCIAETYLNMRLFHLGRQATENLHTTKIRQVFRKLTQFKGQ